MARPHLRRHSQLIVAVALCSLLHRALASRLLQDAQGERGVEAWEDELYLRSFLPGLRQARDLSSIRIYPSNVSGTYKGTWHVSPCNSTSSSASRFPDLRQETGHLVFQLRTSPSPHPQVHLVQGDVILRDELYISESDVHMRLEGVYVRPFGQLRMLLSSGPSLDLFGSGGGIGEQEQVVPNPLDPQDPSSWPDQEQREDGGGAALKGSATMAEIAKNCRIRMVAQLAPAVWEWRDGSQEHIPNELEGSIESVREDPAAVMSDATAAAAAVESGGSELGKYRSATVGAEGLLLSQGRATQQQQRHQQQEDAAELHDLQSLAEAETGALGGGEEVARRNDDADLGGAYGYSSSEQGAVFPLPEGQDDLERLLLEQPLAFIPGSSSSSASMHHRGFPRGPLFHMRKESSSSGITDTTTERRRRSGSSSRLGPLVFPVGSFRGSHMSPHVQMMLLQEELEQEEEQQFLWGKEQHEWGPGIAAGLPNPDPSSSSCFVTLHINATAVNVEAHHNKAVNYTLMVTFVSFLQVLFLMKQMEHSNTQAGAARVSMLTIGQQAIMDAYLCLLHLTAGIVVESLFNAFATAAFFKFVIFSVFEMRYLLAIWKARRPSGGADSWDVMRRELSLLYSRFYGCLLGGIVLMYHLGASLRPLLLLLFLFWVPQIVTSISRDARRPLHPLYIVGISVTRLAIPLYVFGCPNNVMRVRPDPAFCVLLVALVVVQAVLLLLQHAYGPRCLVPRRFLPEKYSYFRRVDCLSPSSLVPRQKKGRNADEEVALQSCDVEAASLEVDCVICMAPVDLGHTSISQRMVTPCDHCFHPPCLQRWMDIKLECPTCRRALPPL